MNYIGYIISWSSDSDLQGTNVVGHFVFTKNLLPILLASATTSPDSTRVVWTAADSHHYAPDGTINFADVNLPDANAFTKYGQSKAVYLNSKAGC